MNKIILRDLVTIENKEDLIRIGDLKKLEINKSDKSVSDWMDLIIDTELTQENNERLVSKEIEDNKIRIKRESGLDIKYLTIGDYLTADISDLVEKYGEIRPVYVLINLMVNVYCNESTN